MSLLEAHPIDDAAAFGARLEAARQTAGLSYDTLARRIYDHVGITAPTSETLRIYHLGRKDPAKADIILVAALADVYGIRISELSPTVAARIDKAAELFRNRCFSEMSRSDTVSDDSRLMATAS